MFVPRTDLALEAAALSVKKPDEKLNGVDSTDYTENSIKVTKVKITNEEGERIIGKAKGNYVTLEFPSVVSANESIKESLRKLFTKELKEIISPHKPRVIFVVGLGNRYITPDSLGPNVADAIDVNRHISKDELALCSVSPGVLGITGIETGEIIEGITEKIKPDVIIAIDALASRSMERICTTIQIADTGITPGAGVGNRRKELSKRTLGIPVIAVGVPTVVDAATVANDSVDLLLETINKDIDADSIFSDDSKRYALIKKILSPYFGELIVTPSEIDSVIGAVAGVIAGGINDLGEALS